MTEKSPKKLVIVGGGSAGWMTAIYLQRRYNNDRQNFDITVIESPDIGIIGVGEATVHSVRYFFQAMGLDEVELMRETNATYKTGILFCDWKKPADGKAHEYFHPFEQQQTGRRLDVSSLWILSNRRERERYDEAVSLSAALIREGHGPKGPASRQYEGVVPYGYHIDAALLARYLRRKAVDAGVRHIEGTITDIVVDNGLIRTVKTADADFAGDVFIDCTGFRGMLIDKLKDDNWDSFEDALPCNRAVAIQRELTPGEAPNPYTISTALSNGWAWQIDLVNRQGTGYVYDGDRMSADQAEAELRAFIGEAGEIIKCTHLRMKIGCRREFWVGNCIATGLAGGFIEPLESTGLHLINLAAGLIATHLSADDTTQPVRDSFNRLMTGFYQELKQFIVLHYCLTDRDDTDFWRAAPATVDETPALADQLQVWRHKICEFSDMAGSFSTVFSDENYRYILYGMGHYPALGLDVDQGDADAAVATLQGQAAGAVQATVPHLAYLRQLNL